jgi:ferredoxin, 2Fe-2S
VSAAASPPSSHRARVEPVGLDIEVRPGETLFDAAWREGYEWPTICMGQALCTYCHVRLLDGADNASSAERNEQLAIRRVARRLYMGDEKGVRLACQVQLRGDIIVEQTSFKGERRPGA